MSSEKFKWEITDIIQLAQDLNEKGKAVKEAIAKMYNLFKTDISAEWTGNNVNNVIDDMNSHASLFYAKTKNAMVVIPNQLVQIGTSQSTTGYGAEVSFSDDGNVNDWLIPKTPVSATGNIRITVDKVHRYFESESEPSVRARISEVQKCLDSYISSADEGVFKDDEAIKNVISSVAEFKQYFEEELAITVEATIDVANQEIRGIENANYEQAKKAAQIGDGAFTSAGKSAGNFIRNIPEYAAKGAENAGVAAQGFVNGAVSTGRNIAKGASEIYTDSVDRTTRGIEKGVEGAKAAGTFTKGVYNEAVDRTTQGIDTTVEGVKSGYKAAKDFTSGVYNEAVDNTTDAIEKGVEGAKAAGTFTKGVYNEAVDNTTDAIGKGVEGVKSGYKAAKDFVTGVYKEAVDNTTDAIENTANGIYGAVEDVANDAEDWASRNRTDK